MVAPFGPSPGVARVVSLRSLRVPPRHYLPGTAWGKVQESGGSSDALERPWDPAAVTGPDPKPKLISLTLRLESRPIDRTKHSHSFRQAGQGRRALLT